VHRGRHQRPRDAFLVYSHSAQFDLTQLELRAAEIEPLATLHDREVLQSLQVTYVTGIDQGQVVGVKRFEPASRIGRFALEADAMHEIFEVWVAVQVVPLRIHLQQIHLVVARLEATLEPRQRVVVLAQGVVNERDAIR
jgi:hypothetical protein